MLRDDKLRKCIECPNKLCKNKFIAKPGLSEDVVRKISKDKREPEWMLTKRLEALRLFNETKLPTWGPDLSNLNLDSIIYYAVPDAKEESSWSVVRSDIKSTFDGLGIIKAEKENLFSGVGAQYDSSMVYHNLKQEFKEKGIIFENMDNAIHKYPDLAKKYFMSKCVPVSDHKFSMLHAAVWSGGTFIYVPKGVKVDVPLQSYFRMNARSGGQFEHTIIIADENSEIQYIEGCSAPKYASDSIHAGCVEIFVGKGAVVKYSSIENWSKNVYNLNTKRAIVEEKGRIEWVSGNMGSGTTMLYPMSVLVGDYSSSSSLGVAFAGAGQRQDVGSKVVHIGSNTSSIVRSKSISKDGGTTTYRGLVKISKNAKNAKSLVECDTLLLDDKSFSTTYPKVENSSVTSFASHEARVGRISDEQIYYLLSRGFDEDTAKKFIISGFVAPIANKFPLEYAVEFNKLIDMQMDSRLG